VVKKLIDILIRVKKVTNKISWDSNKIGILVYERNKWRQEKLLQELKTLDHNKYEIRLASGKLQYYALSQGAKIIFAYGLSKHADKSELKLLYMALVGDKIQITDPKFLIKQPRNFAWEYIAQYVFSSVLSFQRGIIQNIGLTSNHEWNQKPFVSESIGSIDRMKIGILGFGAVGQKVASYFSKIGSEIHVFDNRPDCDIPNNYTKYSSDNWQEILKKVDYFIIAISDLGNEKLIDKNAFEKMNKNLCIVNISRGKIIDEECMVSYLQKKKIKGAILDVFVNEPLPRNNALWKLDNVVITPHIAGNINLVFDEIIADFKNEILCLNI
jgi:lactate dehydrogenase-like 2-hydroxyacid dehydrogenase